MSDSLRSQELQYTRHPCPSLSFGVSVKLCSLSQWCHPTISSSVVPFSSCPQSFPASGSFPTSQFFPSGGQRIGASASASILPMNIQEWVPLGWTGFISVQSKGVTGVFSSTTIWTCCCWVASVLSDSVWPHRRQPTRLLRPWDSPGKKRGVNLLHFTDKESEANTT